MLKGRPVKFAWDPLLSYFREPMKNEIHVLYLHFVFTSFLLLSYFREPQKKRNSCLIFTLCFYIVFVHYFDLNFANTAAKKHYNTTCLVITFNNLHYDIMSIERHVGQ